MTVIKINNEIENEKVQKTLFKIGYEWNRQGCYVREFDSYPFILCLDYLSRKIIWSCYSSKNIIPISAKHFLWKYDRKLKKLKI